MSELEELKVEINRLARELKTIREHTTIAIQIMRVAESEVPEKVRRFANYMHDLHDIKFMYEEHGTPPPEYLLREIERLHDRYRQILKEMNAEGGTFNKVRREMAADPENTYDHMRFLEKPKGESNEAGKCE